MAEQDPELLALGRTIRRLREQTNMTKGELAGAAGLTRGRLAAIEAGRHDPHLDELMALAEGLNIKPAELVGQADAGAASEA
jgi:transcriptional regulator with XRE-family HTH domain